jgi:hypothetical protein
VTSEHQVERAEKYWRHELDGAAAAAFEAHVGTCDACRAASGSIRLAMTVLDDWETPRGIDRALQDRLVALRPRARRTSMLRIAAVLAAIVSGVGGFALGRSSVAGPPGVALSTDSTLRSFLILLEEPAWPPPAPLSRSGYGDWADALRQRQRLIGAEKLTEEPGVRLGTDGRLSTPVAGSSSPNLSGWFVVRARDYADAAALTRLGPHLRYGSVMIRQVE